MTHDESGARRRRGRRTGRTDTRDSILAAATALFATRSFDQVSTRDIGQAAGVDPAMIHHYFGSKAELFRTTLQAPIDPAKVFGDLAGRTPTEQAQQLIHRAIRVWDSPAGAAIFAVVRNVVSNQRIAALAREFLVVRVVRPIVREHEPDAEQARQREALIVAHMAGILMARYMLQLEPLVSASADDITRWFAPNLERALVAPLD